MKTNKERLVMQSLQGKIHHPLGGNYRITHEGHPQILPATGGITYNVKVGDPAFGWAGDHVEPGVSIRNEVTNENAALTTFACIGNKAKVVSGDAKGKEGYVIGVHGGINHVMISFDQEDLELMAIDDKILVKGYGQGMKLNDHPDITVMSLDPMLFEKMGVEEKDGTLIVDVVAEVPAYLMGSGIGSPSAYTGDYDIMTADEDAIKEFGLDKLCFGDIVLLRDCDNSYGRGYLKGAVSLGVIMHSDCVKMGHGPGVSTIMTSKTPVIKGRINPNANGVTGLGGIVSAHSHKTVAGDVNGVAIVQAYKYGRSLGKLSVELNDDGTVKDVVATVDSTYKTKSDIIADEATEVIYTDYETKMAPVLNEKVGTATAAFEHGGPNVSALGLWVSEVMAEKGGVQIGLQNGGGLRRTLEAGDITMGDLYEVMPYDNQVVTMELPGKDLKAAIENGLLNPNIGDGSFSGLKVVYNSEAEFGSRLVSITLTDGTPILDDEYYSLATNDFILTGGDKYDFSNARNVVDTFVPIRDVLVEAIKATGSISPKEVNLVQDLESYTVVSGDVLWKIARTNNTTIQMLVDLNKLANANFILVGQQLVLPVE